MADPAMVYADGEYHGFATSTTWCTPGGCPTYWVPHLASSSLDTSGGLRNDALPDVPAWVRPSDRAIWAPSVAEIAGRWVMYFTATADSGPGAGNKCLGTATATSVQGPYTPDEEPLVCHSTYWNIDPYAVTDGQDWYLLWREDDADNITGKIVGAQLQPDGLGFAGLAKRTILVGEYPWEDGNPHPALKPEDELDRSAPEYATDTGSTRSHQGIGPIENPAMARHPDTGQWILSWSANSWQTQNYATGLATCDGPLGPCTRVSTDAPWLRTTEDEAITTSAWFGGMGGLSFVDGHDGQLYAVLHGYRRLGEHPELRIGWVYRVAADDDYSLTEL
jgi:hypothetical protein